MRQVVEISGRVQASFQKCQTMPPPAKILCWRLLPVSTFSCGTPDQKSRASPRRLNRPIDLHIESNASLQYAPSGSGFARVWSPKLKRGTFVEMAKSSPKTYPGGNCLSGKRFNRAAGVIKKDEYCLGSGSARRAYPRRGSDERDFHRERPEPSNDVSSIIYFEGQSFAEAQSGSKRGAGDALIGDESPSNIPVNSFFCAAACARKYKMPPKSRW